MPNVTQQSSQCVESSKDIILQELDVHLGIIGRGSKGFYPLRDMINCYKDVKIVSDGGMDP